MLGYHSLYQKLHYMSLTIKVKKLLEKYELNWKEIKE